MKSHGLNPTLGHEDKVIETKELAQSRILEKCLREGRKLIKIRDEMSTGINWSTAVRKETEREYWLGHTIRPFQ